MDMVNSIEKKIERYRQEGFPKVWVADVGDGTYTNPIIHSDYSDPDVIRVGEDFYMVASSFNCVPGFPILHSKDLVNWKVINYIVQSIPFDGYDETQHGKAVWAPSMRYHNGYYWVYVGMPDEGIFMSKTTDPYSEWEPLHCVKETRGWIDTCPFWDDDGQAYLVNGFAKSRIGFKSILAISKMTPDGKYLTDEFRIVIDGNIKHPTIEGPKMYKKNGYYYISAPAGGVGTGYQVVLRSKNIYGPYEDKVVLHQGDSTINGPHQGGWVELENGEAWFIHFQDNEAYGRIVHLQPMTWVDDWPVLGIDTNNDGIGEPVLQYQKPSTSKQYPIDVPATSDDFDDQHLGLQWQWHANPKSSWYSTGLKSIIRLFAQKTDLEKYLWHVPNLLLQKFPALAFTVTAKIGVNNMTENDLAGLIIMGMVYSSLCVRRNKEDFEILSISGDGPKNTEAITVMASYVEIEFIYFSCRVEKGARCTFYYSIDGEEFICPKEDFLASKGQWIGAKFGLTAINYERESQGFIDCDWVIVEEDRAF